MAKKESLLLPQLLKKIASKIGANVLVEPRWGIVGQITFKDGRKSYFRYNTLDLNPVGASDVAKDKAFAAYFMEKMGYPTARSRAFFSDRWATAVHSEEDTRAALRFAHGRYPLIVKPNSGSQGQHVQLVHNSQELKRALKEIFLEDRVALLQEFVRGRDYRVVVLDDKVISAYERIPLNVVGDGKSTIKQLLAKKQKQFLAANRDTRIQFDDVRITAKLRQQKRSFGSILKKNEKLFLLDNANLSTGGDAIDVTEEMHPAFQKMAVKLTKDMGLRLCGVDLIIDGPIAKKSKTYWILEVNASPGLDHYVQTGKAQRKVVEEMYLKVLKSLEK
jgi:D-alanine-D-alanine ligase-like ATP-grasp enzyme